MSTWFPYVRNLHVVCGMIALFVAPAAMLTVKGGLAHRRWGKVYFWMMAALAITATVMTFYRPVLFLALVAVFSFYFALRGYRSVVRKDQPASRMDWVAALVTLAGSLDLIVLGIHPLRGGFVPASAVSIAFGFIGATISATDIKRFLKPPLDVKTWWYSHMGGMLGSYIAAVSAFSAVDFHFLPIVVRWLWPSAIGIPGIIIWISFYRKKFTRQPEQPLPPRSKSVAEPT
jgi:hypothetical protein